MDQNLLFQEQQGRRRKDCAEVISDKCASLVGPDVDIERLQPPSGPIPPLREGLSHGLHDPDQLMQLAPLAEPT